LYIEFEETEELMMLLGRSTEGLVYVFEQPVRLLIVDDDPIMREFAIAQLSHPGGEIVTAENGEAAWDILQGEGEFDLVISDLEMPVMNGFGLLANIRSSPRHAKLPVVVLTSRDDMFAIDRAFEVGATSFATKPVNWRLLGYQLRYVMRGCDMEAQVRRAHEDAERTSKLRDDLLTLLKHETRTPLNAIIGYTELLQKWQDAKGQSLQDQLSFIDDLKMAGLGLNRILQRVFYFAQLNSGNIAPAREPLSIEDLLDDVARCNASKASDRGVVVQIHVGSDELFVVGDYDQLSRALNELVTNAIRFGPERSTVLIMAGLDADGSVVIDVSDQGQGLEAEQLRRCIEPFAQGEDPLTRHTEGLGLGLPTAKRVIDLHAGRMSFTSSSSGGLNVRITLPEHHAVARTAANNRTAA
jgi:two-component system sensor histidine kinase/response regulator